MFLLPAQAPVDNKLDTNKLIEIVQEIKNPVEPAKPLYTLEEKIARNHFNCDTDTHYISAEDATCLDKPVAAPEPLQAVSAAKTVNSAPVVKKSNLATAPIGYYPVNQCTHYVWSQRPAGAWGNGNLWFDNARRDGWATGLTPQAGAIGVAKSGNHVVLIEKVDGNRVYLSERNYDFRGSYRERWASASDFRYIY